jgi:hypothetical protein
MSDQIKTTAEAIEAAVLPEAYMVNVGDDNGERVAQKPLPLGVTKKSLEQKSPAEWAYERMVLYIQDFEEKLDSDHEVGMGFTGGDVGTLKIQGMGYFAPDILTFYGEDPEGSKVQLVQHISQLNVMLVAAPKQNEQSEPNRIGFKLAEDLDEVATS